MSNFFISTALGFENELVQELKEFWFELMDLDGLPTRAEFPEVHIVPGGVELNCADHLGFQINFFSKIAHRVLLRIEKFEARYFDQLEKEVKKLDLSKWLQSCDVEFKIESHKSRLNNEKNIEEVFVKNLIAKKSSGVIFNVVSGGQKIYVRLFKDQVTISLDTSGEHLHRRGYAEFRGEAPLRETLAAFMVRYLRQQTSFSIESTILLDPFAGSGTILFEAASAVQPNFFRNYSWLSFKTCPKLFKSPSWKGNYRWLVQTNLTAYAVDQDENALYNIKKNSALFFKIFPAVDLNLKRFCMKAQDFEYKAEGAEKVWIVTNPPYGHRLASDNIPKVLTQLEEQIASLQGIVLIHPLDWKMSFKTLKLKNQMPFSNQGLKLSLSIFAV